MEGQLLNGKQIAENIRDRCRELKKKTGQRLTVKQVFKEAELSYLTYKSWMGGRCEPRTRTVQKVDRILKAHEEKAVGGVCTITG